MTAPVVAAALVFWICVFMVYFTAASTTPLEFFFGRLEPPPPDLGIWKAIAADADGKLVREERCVLPDGRLKASYLIRQVRYRDVATREIVRVDPEQRLPRRRVSSRP